MNKPQVGQTLYVLNVGNQARGKKPELKPAKVTKVGTKLVTCEGGYLWKPTQFHLDSGRNKSEYSADWMLYETEQEWLDEKAVGVICRRISEAFEYGNNRNDLSLDKLRIIEAILNEAH